MRLRPSPQLDATVAELSASTGPVGVAVSGGGDSVAMLESLSGRLPAHRLRIVTVDHGLRPEATDECAFVNAAAQAKNLQCETLVLSDLAAGGNLMARAADARRAAIAKWARSRNIADVCLGHTRDDVAESFLLRLGRGAGLAGLAAMTSGRERCGIRWHRPMLDHGRAELRDALDRAGTTWIDDPSNTDDRFDRSRIRRHLALLSDVGIDAEGLAMTAHRLRSADQVAEDAARCAFAQICHVEHGDVLVDASAFGHLPSETSFRILSSTLKWIGNSPYPPRAEQVLRMTDLAAGRTLNGVIVTGDAARPRLTREFGRVRDHAVSGGDRWDGRWHAATKEDGCRVAALGEVGLRQCPEWRKSGIPRAALLAAPAIWRDDNVLHAPVLRIGRPDALQIRPHPLSG